MSGPSAGAGRLLAMLPCGCQAIELGDTVHVEPCGPTHGDDLAAALESGLEGVEVLTECSWCGRFTAHPKAGHGPGICRPNDLPPAPAP